MNRELEMKLLDDPKHSSGWIENAGRLIEKCGLTEEELSKFDTEQLQLIVSMFTSAEANPEIDIDAFLNPELNSTQMQVLLTGYSNGLKTSQLKPYFDPSIPYIKSNWAIAALAEGNDITNYVLAGYDKDQLYEIYAGLKDGVDVSVYDCINLPAEKMAIAHHALRLGLNVSITKRNELTIE